MTLSLLTILSAAVFVAAFIQGALGIGFALIVAPIIGLLAPALLPATLLILMLPLNAHVGWRERANVDWTGARWITLGRFAGTFGGLWLLAALSVQQLDLAVGGFTIIAAAAALVAPRFDPSRPMALGVGIFTGITETSTGIGGPPLALLYQHARGPVLRSTVAICFLVGELISLLVLALAGRIGPEHMLGASSNPGRARRQRLVADNARPHRRQRPPRGGPGVFHRQRPLSYSQMNKRLRSGP